MRHDPHRAALKLATFQQYVPDIQDALPLDAADRPSKRGHATPMEVMDAPFRAGDLRHGYQAVADNLPNDPRIHEKVGSKKITSSKDFEEALKGASLKEGVTLLINTPSGKRFVAVQINGK